MCLNIGCIVSSWSIACNRQKNLHFYSQRSLCPNSQNLWICYTACKEKMKWEPELRLLIFWLCLGEIFLNYLGWLNIFSRGKSEINSEWERLSRPVLDLKMEGEQATPRKWKRQEHRFSPTKCRRSPILLILDFNTVRYILDCWLWDLWKNNVLLFALIKSMKKIHSSNRKLIQLIFTVSINVHYGAKSKDYRKT